VNLQELRARRAAVLLPLAQACEVEKRFRRESLPPEVVDLLLDAVTHSFYDASAALREARRAAAPSVVPPPPPRSG
jgi:hypothetical protein